MTRVADLEKRLTACSTQLKMDLDPIKRATMLDIIDGLLDERNALVGVPAVKAEQMRTCTGCHQRLPVRYIPPAISGARTVGVIDCLDCDRSKCKCGRIVADRRAMKCPAGHWLDRN